MLISGGNGSKIAPHFGRRTALNGGAVTQLAAVVLAPDPKDTVDAQGIGRRCTRCQSDVSGTDQAFRK
jgi:hypothetical protein